jgi:hypothetical protein
MALRSLANDTKSLFFICKEIDGQPKANGTWTIMACRVGVLINPPVNRQLYYESIADPDEVRRQVVEMHRLRWIGVPQHSLDRYLLVFWTFESARSAPMGNIPYPKT